MATGRMEFHSGSLMQHTYFSFVLPNDIELEEVRDLQYHDRGPLNLILLHGLTGTDTDWLYGGGVQQMAVQYNLNVFMPTTGNTFYLDHGYPGRDYCTFVGQELPEYLQSTFGIEMKRENTLIGGLSMGGFGAIHTALAFPQRFSVCIALSSAIHVDYMAEAMRGGVEDVIPLEMAKLIFGGPVLVYYMTCAIIRLRVLMRKEYEVYHGVVVGASFRELRLNSTRHKTYGVVLGMRTKDVDHTLATIVFIPDEIYVIPDNEE